MPTLDGPPRPKPAGAAAASSRSRPDDVVDLAADAAEDPHLALGEGGPQLGLLAGEGDQLGRSLERDDAPAAGSGPCRRGSGSRRG